jgi:hypothetical protein
VTELDRLRAYVEWMADHGYAMRDRERAKEALGLPAQIQPGWTGPEPATQLTLKEPVA